MQTYRFLSFSLLLFLLVISVSACIKTTKTHGYVMHNSVLKSFKKGSTTKAEVGRLLGSPSSVSSFGDEVWYYISTTTESIAFLDPKISEQTIVAVIFKGDVMKDLRKYTLKDQKQIAYIEEATRTGGVKLSVFEQLLGNVGRFNPQDLQ